ncbi:MAG: epimerase [Acidobacteria bacterium]|nr:MAG: epimerase [Acidobacteriota bacterium]
MKKVLVTGANGFLGQPTLSLLREHDFEVHAISSKTLADRQGEIFWHQANLLNDKQTREIIAIVKPTHLLHLAWYTEPGKYWTATENLEWMRSSEALLHAFAAAGGKRVLFAGTCAEYDWNAGRCSELNTPLVPATLYGTCKRALQLVLETYSRQVGLSSAWARLFFPYGPHERPERFIPTVICSLLEDRPAECSHGNQQRDFLFVQDVAAAFVALLESDVRGPVNIGSGDAVALKEIAFHIGDLLDRTELIRLGAIPAATNDPPLLVADIGRLRDEVGWTPRFNLEQGLAQTVEWWRLSKTKLPRH